MKDLEQQKWIVIIGVLMTIITLSFSLSSCKTQCVPETIEVEKEVIITKHDTSILTEADSASAMALLHCDSLNQVVLDELYTANGDRIKLTAKLKQMQGNLSALDIQCHEDSLQQRIEWLETEIKQNTNKTIVKEVEVEKEVIHNSGFAKFCIWHTIILWIILAIVIAIWILKRVYLHKISYKS